MKEEIQYKPIIKAKGFCPNPVATKFIPKFADSRRYPNVVGTVAWEKWWEEQFHYCLNGYETGGLFIPGRYYYYLNFCYISTVGRGNHFPEFVDADYEFFLAVDEAKKTNKGIMLIKARRRGASEKLKAIINHGLRFTAEEYHAGIVAGLQTYSDALFAKVKSHNSHVAPELFVQHLKSDSEEYLLGYEEKTKQGLVRKGSANKIICKTMGKNPNVLKGHFFDDVAFEESGENEVLEAGYGATKDCFMAGDVMKGTPYIFGTGGDINAASKGFQKMWFDESLDKQFIKIRMHAQRLYVGCFIGSKNADGKLVEDCPNILKNPEYKGKGYTKDQFLGCEDVTRALEKIFAKREELAKGSDRKPYFDNLQNNPTNDNEAFLKFSGNPYDPEKLSLNRTNIASNDLQYKPYILEWKFKDNGTGELCDPLEIKEAREPRNETELRNAVYIAYWPRPGIKNLDVAGIDSYDIDQTMTSKSLGGMAVLRRDIGTIPPQEAMAPACIIRQRPIRKEIFWENCLKVSVFYNLICNADGGNVLIDYAKPGIIEFFKKYGGTKFLAVRPKSIESANSEQVNTFGCNMTPRAKNSMVSYTQSWVDDHISKNVFEILTRELSDYDVETKDSDNDLADAWGLALIRHHDMGYLPTTVTEEKEYNIPEHLYESTDPGSIMAININIAKQHKMITANGTIIKDELSLLINAGIVGNTYDDTQELIEEE